MLFFPKENNLPVQQASCSNIRCISKLANHVANDSSSAFHRITFTFLRHFKLSSAGVKFISEFLSNVLLGCHLVSHRAGINIIQCHTKFSTNLIDYFYNVSSP